MSKYLYGAAVQGIQDFIFQTNKLREIVGASELVEEICTSFFADIVTKYSKETNYNGKNAIIQAAGNIKYVFESENDCREVVKYMPKEVQEFAPGITFSQAVVKYEENEDFEMVVNTLEEKLKIQRNKPMRSQTLGLMGTLRSRHTGLPVTNTKTINGKKEYLDAGAYRKYFKVDELTKDIEQRKTTQHLCAKAFGSDKIKNKNICYDTDEMTKLNDWIAIIHADGNGLGNIIRKIGKKENVFKDFSLGLNNAIINAAQEAFNYLENEKKIEISDNKKIPIRPIALSGEDFNVICRADLALPYIQKFLEKFQELTRVEIGSILQEHEVFSNNEDYLTACAGIAYVKSSFPFYYGYELAEELCKEAKNDAKNGLSGNDLAKSCLMFHKVQDSFTQSYDEIADRELRTFEDISFKFGPYYLEKKENRWTIENLIMKEKALDSKEGNAVKSHLRQWMSILHEDGKAVAEQKLKRLKAITTMKDYVDSVTDEKIKHDNAYPVYDILAVHSIYSQVTKEE